MTLEFHPYAEIFPLIEGEAFEALVADIKANGLREPIVLHEGKILDGRNRYRAALQAGVIDARGKAVDWQHHRPTTRQFMTSGLEGDPLTWVISANLHRRHLDDRQRAMVATRLATLGHGGARASKAPIGALDEEPPLPLPAMTQAAAAAAFKVSERQVERARVIVDQGAPELVAAADAGQVALSVATELAKLPVEEQREVLRSASPSALYRVIKDQRDALTAQKKTKRAAKEKALGARQRALPAKRYGVIYADPAWRFEPRSRESGMDRAPENHYPTMTTDDIRALPVRDIAATDCALFLWATAPMLVHAISVMEAWGFDYKSNVVWLKDGPAGTGYWFRNKHELLLLGTRGNPPAPAQGLQWRSLIEAAPGEHSAKPPEFAALIEEYFPTLPKIELNARKARPGWDVWGNEAPEAEAAPVPRETVAPFIVEHDGIRAIVARSYDWEIYAVDLNRPFPSETGYRSMIGHPRQPGDSDEAHGRRLIEAAMSRKEGKTVKAERLRLPETAYSLPAGADGKPVPRRRGVWVDRDAPPFGLHLDHLDGLDVILARWKGEDSASFSGQKIKRSCPVSLHPNHKIVAVSGQMLTPLAEFPTSGAYAVTAFKWIDGKHVEGWAYVDEAAFHDAPVAEGDFSDAPAEGETVEVPAFLRRAPATLDDAEV